MLNFVNNGTSLLTDEDSRCLMKIYFILFFYVYWWEIDKKHAIDENKKWGPGKWYIDVLPYLLLTLVPQRNNYCWKIHSFKLYILWHNVSRQSSLFNHDIPQSMNEKNNKWIILKFCLYLPRWLKMKSIDQWGAKISHKNIRNWFYFIFLFLDENW